MKLAFVSALGLAVLSASAISSKAANWKATEQIVYYPISGQTGRALYESIGKQGPELAAGRRVIAHTTFDLKWRRNYKPQNGGCRLVSARPFFKIIYTLPKPKGRLKNTLKRDWGVFSAGILEHEKVHGVYAREMVEQIIKTTVGLSVKGDSKCRKIRDEVLTRVKTAYRDYKRKGRVFDRADLGVGGNVQKLVIVLIRSK